jgi:hypothetical protein
MEGSFPESSNAKDAQPDLSASQFEYYTDSDSDRQKTSLNNDV